MATIKAKTFWDRALRIRDEMVAGSGKEDNPWHGVGGFCEMFGKLAGDEDAGKAPLGEALHRYLFGILFTNTIILVLKTKVVVIANPKKVALLEKIQAKGPEGFALELHALKKENTEELLQVAVEALKASVGEGASKVATLFDELKVGNFADKWVAKLKGSGLPVVNASPCLQSVMMRKFPDELATIKKAGEIAVRVMKRGFVKKMENVFEEDEKVTNAKLAAQIDAMLVEQKKKLKLKDVDLDDVELGFETVVQSGGEFDLAVPNKSKDTPFNSDVLIAQIGVRYLDYYAVVSRTYFVNAPKEEGKAYKALHKARMNLVEQLKPGASLGEVHASTLAVVEKEAPELAKHLTSSFGWGSGSELKFGEYLIVAGSKQVVEEGMTFVVSLGLENVQLSESGAKKASTLKGGKYSCVIADTVIVDKSPKPNLVTGESKAEFDDLIYNLQDGSDSEEDSDEDDSDDDMEEEEDETARLLAAAKGERVTRSRTKPKEQLEEEQKASKLEQKMQEVQEKLMRDKAKRALKRESKGDGGDNDAEEEEEGRIPEAYSSTAEYPPDFVRNQIYCDRENESVLLPIGGYHVPFHIQTIKAVSKTDEDRASLLKFSFFYPTGNLTFARDVPGTMRTVMTKFPELRYVKEMSFRSKDSRNLNLQFRAIKELQKRVRQRQKLEEQQADIIDQVDLVLSRDRNRPPELTDVNMRPPLRKGKCMGRVQAHVNGLRFRMMGGGRQAGPEVFDLIYSNVKHFFFQECKQELTVLIHFHLKHPVMIGRTKTYDVQFYTEVVEASAALEGSRRSTHDPDEMEEERREKILKKKLNAAFRKFCQEVVKVADLNNEPLGIDNDFDVPFRRLAFQGVPNKEMVWLIPTVHCLVNLTETPFFVVALDDIEHIHFERVTNLTKNIDMVIVLKAQLKRNSSIPQRITSIPIEALGMIRKWLHEKGDITFTAGTTSLSWKAVMASVQDEIEMGIFWKDKDLDGEPKDIGWNFLKLEDDNDSDEEGGDGDADSEFDDEDVESSEDDEDDWDDEVEEEESSEEDDEDNDSEGDDWDELEREAEEDDKKKNRKEREREEAERSQRSKKRR
ncbi:FACT complex subunit SPT16 (Facilitates chromatin transcription complex subunit SPT16) (Global transcription factor group C protein 102) [Durusdinium trenchii]|uniref:FACT complex subunit n=1 Tax=Durusdinium trenchii TaxID=1381693 RepID=A0ABP0J6C4_9DINO